MYISIFVDIFCRHCLRITQKSR